MTFVVIQVKLYKSHSQTMFILSCLYLVNSIKFTEIKIMIDAKNYYSLISLYEYKGLKIGGNVNKSHIINKISKCLY